MVVVVHVDSGYECTYGYPIVPKPGGPIQGWLADTVEGPLCQTKIGARRFSHLGNPPFRHVSRPSACSCILPDTPLASPGWGLPKGLWLALGYRGEETRVRHTLAVLLRDLCISFLIQPLLVEGPGRR